MSEIKAEWTNKDNLSTETTASDYIKREDASRLIHAKTRLSAFMKGTLDGAQKSVKKLCDGIDAIPAAEVVPIGEEYECGYTDGQMAERKSIVHCKDCKYIDTCCRNIFTEPTSYETSLTHCSAGKRKEQEHE